MVLQFCPEYYIISGTKLRGDIMQSSYSEKIKQRIENSPPGTIFINSDFTDIAKTETIGNVIKEVIYRKYARKSKCL